MTIPGLELQPLGRSARNQSQMYSSAISLQFMPIIFYNCQGYTDKMAALIFLNKPNRAQNDRGKCQTA
jgi:hypothetical protein